MEWLTPALVVAMLCGGLGGAVFTWWIKRDPSATLGYVITTTSTGAGGTVKSLVPDLSLRLGERDIPAIHTHVIKLTVTHGFSPAGKVAIIFAEKVEIFGHSFVPPTPLHSMKANTIREGFTCEMSPLDKHATYNVLLATDCIDPPELKTAGREFRLRPLTDIASQSQWALQTTALIFGAMGTLGATGIFERLLTLFRAWLSSK